MGGSDNIQNRSLNRFHPFPSDIKSETPLFPPPDTMTFPPPQSSPSSPTLSFDFSKYQSEFKTGAGSEPPSTESGGVSSFAVKPLESLHEIPIPPFLSKTYDFVDDPSLDYIISWGQKGNSFVVWRPVEFARAILPRNFKHSNFSSFVRQLNTYGFRKIDTDKWEFANEGFVRGQKHLLKTIRRRKSNQSQQFQSSSEPSTDASKAAFEGEIKALRKERSLMMQEVVQLQHDQCGTAHHIEDVKKKLDAAEGTQKQMVSFLGEMLMDPAFLVRLSQLREQKSLRSPRTKRKFIEHERGPSPEGNIVKYQPELCKFSGHDVGDGLFYGAENGPSQVEDSAEDEIAMVNEFLHTQETTDTILEQKGVIKPQMLSVNENCISSSNDMMTETSNPEYSIAGTESIIEDTGVGYEGGGMPSSAIEPWGYFSNYNELGDVGVSSGLLHTWEVCSGVERWLDEDSPIN